MFPALSAIITRNLRPDLRAAVLALVLAAPGLAVAQTAAILPEALARVPAGSSYWQQLRIALAHDDEANPEAIAVTLPEGMVVRDQDGDGALFDEIRVVYRAADGELPRFRAATTTTAGRIVVTSQERAGAGGEVYIQFPVTVAAIAADSAVYGPIEFADPREFGLSGQEVPAVTFVPTEALAAAGSMGLVAFAAPLAPGADTTTTAAGAEYPSAAEVLVLSLPDLVFDSGQADPNRGSGQGDGDEANDTVYRFFFASRGDLTSVGASVAFEALRASDGTPYVEREGVGGSVQLRTRDLTAGVYWLYAVADVTGTVPLGRSRALQVRHEPVIERVGPLGTATGSVAPVTFDSGGLLNEEGVADGRGLRRLTLELAAVDHDDDAVLHLFYSGNPNLGPADVQLQGETVFLEGGTAITIADGLAEETKRFDWNTAGPPRVEAGDYYVYAVAVGGQQSAVDRTSQQILVRHSPFLRLDPLRDDGVEPRIVTGGIRPQRFVTLAWGRSGADGDFDADGDATIDLFYSDRSDFPLPGGVDEIAAAAADPAADTHRIAAFLAEDPDGRSDNQFVWDLWALDRGDVPVEDRRYFVYGAIAAGDTRRLVQMNGGRVNDAGSGVRFFHPPSVRPLHPAADLSVDGATARVSWEDADLDDDARIRIVLSAEDHGEVASYDAVTSGLAFVANSADGRAQPEADPRFDLSEDSGDDDYDLGTAHLTRSFNGDSPPQPGTYLVYLAIEDGDRFDSDTQAWRAPGKLRITAPATPPLAGTFRLRPQTFTIGNGGGVQTVDVVVDAAGDTVDLVRAQLRVNAARFDVLDQDPVAPGVQPFRVATGFGRSKLMTNTAEVAADSGLFLAFEYLDPVTAGIPGLDGARPLVRFDLVARSGEGIEPIEVVTDTAAGRISQLERDGRPVAVAAPAPLANALLVAGRAALSGRVVLEGRSNRAALVDAALRRFGEHADLQDSAFAAANDQDAVAPGVQVALDGDGDFALLEVPTGRLDLHLRRAGYLEGQASGLVLFPGSIAADLRVSTTGAPGDSLLRGGDVAGYADTSGRSMPDNEVTLADWDFVASLFDRQLPASHDSARADISGDGLVNIRDLTLVGANFLSRGAQPVYRSAGVIAPAPPLRAWLEGAATGAARGDTVELTLATDNGAGRSPVRAAQADLRFDAAGWRLVEARGPEGWLATHRDHEWGQRLAVTAAGAGDLTSGRATLASWTLVARIDDPPPATLGALLLLDGQHRDVPVDAEAQQAAAATSVDESGPQPEGFQLRPNFPNPFNPDTAIEFYLPTAGDRSHVRLEIYDVLGQRVAVLVDGPQPAGLQRLAWDGRDGSGRALASGVYFSRLSAGPIHRVRSMLLLR